MCMEEEEDECNAEDGDIGPPTMDMPEDATEDPEGASMEEEDDEIDPEEEGGREWIWDVPSCEPFGRSESRSEGLFE